MVYLGRYDWSLSLNREELQKLSDERIEDAQSLLAATLWSDVYDLVGTLSNAR